MSNRDLLCPGTGGLCPHRRESHLRRAAIEGIRVCDEACASWVAARQGKIVHATSSSSRFAFDTQDASPEILYRMRKPKPEIKKEDDDPAWTSRFLKLELPYRIALKRKLEGW